MYRDREWVLLRLFSSCLFCTQTIFEKRDGDVDDDEVHFILFPHLPGNLTWIDDSVATSSSHPTQQSFFFIFLSLLCERHKKNNESCLLNVQRDYLLYCSHLRASYHICDILLNGTEQNFKGKIGLFS
jgi:hypothetical protein